MVAHSRGLSGVALSDSFLNALMQGGKMKLEQTRLAAVNQFHLLFVLVATAIIAIMPGVAAENVPPGPPPLGGSVAIQTVDDADAGWIWSGMDGYSDPDLHGTTGHAGGPGTYGAYTFTGTGVEIYGQSGAAVEVNGRVHKLGSVKVSLDGKTSSEATEKSTGTVYNYLLVKIEGLTQGTHVIQIEPDSGWCVVDFVLVHGSTSTGGRDPLSSAKKVDKPLIPDGYYRLIPQSAPDKYLEVADAACQDGSNIQIHSADPNRHQDRHNIPLGGERYRISPAAAPEEAISVPNLTPELDDPQVIIWTYTGDIRQEMAF